MRKKLFLLGVGAQKCGTTWLHSQMKLCNNVDMGFMKEYHVFDSIYSNECKHLKRKLIESVLAKNEAGILGVNHEKNKHLLKKMSFLDNTENYFEYFDYLHRKNSNIELVGDITPSYSMLNSDAFNHIKNGLEDKGFEIKVVFLMRDPLERVWSMLRMTKRNLSLKGEKDSIVEKSDESALLKLYLTPQASLRTRYERTIKELEKVFTREQIFYGFYEELFTEKTYNSLSDFLGIKLQTPDFDFKANVSPKNEKISVATKREICREFEPAYNFLDERTQGHSRKIWGGYDYL